MKKHKKILLSLLFLTIIIAALCGVFLKSNKPKQSEEAITFEEAYPFLEDLACVKINGKYGYINKTGEFVIPPTYDKSSYFFGGLSIQTKNGLKGCIDTKGNVVIPFEYKDIYPSNGEYISVQKGGKYGCINRNNEIVVDFISTQPVEVYNYDEKHVIAVITNDSNKQGFIDLTTGFTVEPIYDFISPWYNKENIVGTSLGMNYGFINLDTQVVIEPIYSQNIYFSEGLAIASQNFKTGYIDYNGNYVIEPIYLDGMAFSEGLAFVKIDGKYGCINTKGEIVIEPSFAYPSSFTDGVAQVVIDETTLETAYINTNGEFLSYDEYGKSIAKMLSRYWPDTAPFYPTYYMNEDSSQRAMAIDKEGKILFKTIYNEIMTPEHNMAIVMLGNKYGCINERGIEILPAIYENVQIADETTLIIKDKNKYGMVDTLRNEVLPIKYDDIKSFNSKLALVKLDNKWSSLNLETKEFEENIYDNIFPYEDIPFFEFPIPVQKKEKWFYIDENGDPLF